MNPIGALLGRESGLVTDPSAKDSPGRIREAAQQFEALLLEQLLQSMRSDESGWLDSGDDQASRSLVEIAQQQFARALSEGGGLGIARIAIEGVSKDLPPRGTQYK